LVAHAGIGSILTAVELGLPVIIVPRDFKRGEHRNDHQSSTAREFSTRKGVYVATDEATLHDLLDRRRSLDVPERGEIDAAFASRVDAFIQGGL
ncbi:MAG: glycosyltransferase, partial [Thalassolituus sp.]